MVELREVVPEGTHTITRQKIQYRELNGLGEPLTDWKTIPVHVIPMNEYLEL